ncbi:dehydrogenase [Actinomadura sp. LD22]|uniref:Dehydrogenase n=1 Tax=Actinomadura physcomitrii TaxID=2650748 RepID=A0A6I4MT13_9ACTN|nr:acyl-CoA dehydrogenase family protein [Actinomadura physcomitrii]MWA07007.1 dehydrogenase [Actinomadura physcomitrii]
MSTSVEPEQRSLQDEAPEESSFREKLRAWLAEQHLPVLSGSDGAGRTAEEYDEESVRAARDFQRRLAEAGFAALTWPVEYGGQGLSSRYELIFQQEVAGYELPTTLLGVGFGMCGPTVLRHGTDEQRARYIPPLVKGEEIWCQLFSEPGAGSDLASVRSRAVRVDGGWRVNGQKVWTSGGRHSQFGLALLRCDPAAPKHAGLMVAIVDMADKGVEVRPLRQMTGHAKFDEVFLDDVFLPDERLVGEPGEGWTVARTTLLNERVSVAGNTALRGGSVSMLVAAARSAGREQEPRLRGRLADAWIDELVLSLLRERTKRAIEAGRTPGPEGAVGKLAASRYIQSASRTGVLIHGEDATTWDADEEGADEWALRLCAAPGLAIGGGTDEIVKNIIGERVLGLPREPRVAPTEPGVNGRAPAKGEK